MSTWSAADTHRSAPVFKQHQGLFLGPTWGMQHRLSDRSGPGAASAAPRSELLGHIGCYRM